MLVCVRSLIRHTVTDVRAIFLPICRFDVRCTYAADGRPDGFISDGFIIKLEVVVKLVSVAEPRNDYLSEAFAMT